MSNAPACSRCGTTLGGPAESPLPCARCLIGIGLEDDRAAADPAAAIGSRIGPYEIVELLGEGGMGVVYLAEQSEPIRRRVALKLIKLGMDTHEIVTRFESERQTLAMMEHPSIAKVHDAGVSADGRPYFVMEYVPGRPMTDYCDEQCLDLDRRLALFETACDAIQHAHHKGIIHRDVKPSNVLVTEVDGRPAVRVIDFGVSKAVEQEGGGRSLFTRHGVVVGTPEYMSPEQAAVPGRAVDTRTDVYALGLLLYELLTGALPFSVGQRDAGSIDEVYRKIREDTPPRPSSRVAMLGERGAGVAAKRGLDASTLTRRLRGDLDWIVLRCLEKDPDRRYASPRELVEDLRRHRRREPVEAGPPSNIYRLNKFVRRNRVALAFAGLTFLALVTFSVVMTVFAGRVARERDRANREAEVAGEVSRFLVDLFEVSEPGEARGASISAREILDQGATRVAGLSGRPELQARMMETIGVVYKKLGLLNDAAPLLDRSLAIRLDELGESHPDTIQSMLQLADVSAAQGRLGEAETLLGRARDTATRTLGDEHPATLSAMADLAVVLHFQGRLDEAEGAYRETLDRRRRILGDSHSDTLETMNNLAALLVARGDLAGAERHLRQAFEGRRHALGADHPEVLDSAINLGVVLQSLGRLDEAEPFCREAVEIGRRIRPDHPKTLVSINNLGKLLELQGKVDEAEVFYVEALEAFTRTVGSEHADTISAMGNLGNLYTTLLRLEEAEPLLAGAAQAVQRSLPREHIVTGYTLRKYGRFLTAAGRYDEARTMLLDADSILTSAAGADHPQTRKVREDLSELSEVRRRADEPEP
jgi:non-specific serine/threonine protein kinase/serine/threonine-protein kinase